jgi:hypothetical protein
VALPPSCPITCLPPASIWHSCHTSIPVISEDENTTVSVPTPQTLNHHRPLRFQWMNATSPLCVVGSCLATAQFNTLPIFFMASPEITGLSLILYKNNLVQLIIFMIIVLATNEIIIMSRSK